MGRSISTNLKVKIHDFNNKLKKIDFNQSTKKAQVKYLAGERLQRRGEGEIEEWKRMFVEPKEKANK